MLKPINFFHRAALNPPQWYRINIQNDMIFLLRVIRIIIFCFFFNLIKIVQIYKEIKHTDLLFQAPCLFLTNQSGLFHPCIAIAIQEPIN